jgi:prefoldin subunit 5
MGFYINQEKKKEDIAKQIQKMDEQIDSIYQKALRFNDVLDDIDNLKASLQQIEMSNQMGVGLL